jgi:hypothetical protein
MMHINDEFDDRRDIRTTCRDIIHLIVLHLHDVAKAVPEIIFLSFWNK